MDVMPLPTTFQFCFVEGCSAGASEIITYFQKHFGVRVRERESSPMRMVFVGAHLKTVIESTLLCHMCLQHAACSRYQLTSSLHAARSAYVPCVLLFRKPRRCEWNWFFFSFKGRKSLSNAGAFRQPHLACHTPLNLPRRSLSLTVSARAAGKSPGNWVQIGCV